MAVYTASYFETNNHHGKLISISRTIPSDFKGVKQTLDFLAPSSSLLQAWKKKQDETAYIDRYRQECRINLEKIKSYIAKLKSEEDETWLCWERAGSFCHRELAIKFVQLYRPDCYGGCNVRRSDVHLTPKEDLDEKVLQFSLFFEGEVI